MFGFLDQMKDHGLGRQSAEGGAIEQMGDLVADHKLDRAVVGDDDKPGAFDVMPARHVTQYGYTTSMAHVNKVSRSGT